MTPEQRLASFRTFVAQRPDDAFARYSLAMALRSSGERQAAVAEFQELRRRTPDYVPVYLMLGQVLGELQRGAEAAQAYQDGIAAAERRQDGHAKSELSAALSTLRQEGHGTP
jgi:predicted Zn-dependent protease